MLEVNQKCRPAIECVGDCFSKLSFWRLDQFSFIEPVLQQLNFRFCETLPQIGTFGGRKLSGNSFNVKQTFDYAHGKFCRLRISLPGILEIAVDMRPAVGSGRSIGNDLVELVGTICLKNPSKTLENSFWIYRVLCSRVVVENVGIVSISAVDPYISFVGLAEPLFDDGKSGGVGLNDAAVQNKLSHSSNNRSEELSNLLQPPAHGRAIDRDTERFEHLFLPIKWQVKPEFIGCDLGEKTRTRQTFIDRLIGLLSSNDLSIAFLASVLKDDVLDRLEESLDKLDLVGDIETDDFARLPATWARDVASSDAMLFFPGAQAGRWCRASTTLLALGHDIQSLLFGIEFAGSLSVNNLARAGQKRGVDFRRFLAECLAIAPTQLFFQLGNASKEFSDEFVAVA